jgi:DNA recombination protein RmuC
MNSLLIELGIDSPALGLTVGLLVGLLLVVIFSWVASSVSRRKAAEEAGQSEQRINDSFERLAGRIFEERSEKLSQLNEKQLETVLKPLGEQLNDFRRTVAETHRDETAQNRVLQEKLKQLEQLNMRLHDDATNLTKALTSSAKTQGNWGEQQLERLLELAGLEKGREFHTQVSVTSDSGQRIQPDLVLSLPEGKAIIMDSKVSLTAWVRYQSEEDEELRPAHLKAHIQSIRQHIKSLGEKRYAEVADLNALDFVLMFVPIESALIEALQTDPELPAFAMENKVALLSPTNLLATLRTVGSVWAIHRQNNNAQEIAGRAGRLYDKFADFVTALQQIGDRLRQAQDSYQTALTRLSSGSGNLLRQAEMLRELGARASKQIDPSLGSDEQDESSDADSAGLKIVHDASASEDPAP